MHPGYITKKTSKKNQRFTEAMLKFLDIKFNMKALKKPYEEI